MSKPRDADHAESWLYERAEEACSAGLRLDNALQAVRDGYSSAEFDRAYAAGEFDTDRDHVEAESLHRDDLARDVARTWTDCKFVQEVPEALAHALDRLAAAYGEKP